MSQNSTDLRVRRTRKLIQEALIDLIEEYDFESITVGELTKRAMVSRSAFYRNYQDKYDLVEQIFAEALQSMLAEISHPYDFHEQFAFKSERVPKAWTKLFKHLEHYNRLYRALLSDKGSLWFFSKMRTHLVQAMDKRFHELSKNFNKQQLIQPDAFKNGMISSMLAGLFIEAMRWWLENEQPYPPEDIALYCSYIGFTIIKELSL